MTNLEGALLVLISLRDAAALTTLKFVGGPNVKLHAFRLVKVETCYGSQARDALGDSPSLSRQHYETTRIPSRVSGLFRIKTPAYGALRASCDSREIGACQSECCSVFHKGWCT